MLLIPVLYVTHSVVPHVFIAKSDLFDLHVIFIFTNFNSEVKAPLELKVLGPLKQPSVYLGCKHFGCEHKPMPSPLISVFVLLPILYNT